MKWSARVFPAVTGTSVEPATMGPPAKTERLPVADGETTVTFAATERAVEGMPQRPVTWTTAVCDAASGAPPVGPAGSRVSAIRHGTIVWSFVGTGRLQSS